jgi:transcriptional regulator
MHPNPAFRQTDAATALAFARARGFGSLCVNGPAGPLAAHEPFLVEGRAVLVHLARLEAGLAPKQP